MAVSKDTDTVGNWMWYIRNVRENTGRAIDGKEYKEVLMKYISGKPWQTTVEEMKK